jgi:hypothetical protein
MQLGRQKGKEMIQIWKRTGNKRGSYGRGIEKDKSVDCELRANHSSLQHLDFLGYLEFPSPSYSIDKVE